VTNLIDRLEERGFARRVRDATDRRRVVVESVQDWMTAGRTVFASTIRSLSTLLGRYSDAELMVVADFLRRNAERLREETRKLQHHHTSADEE
jgi:DNA-binding MarR family transcriptional regulator